MKQKETENAISTGVLKAVLLIVGILLLLWALSDSIRMFG